MLDAILTTTMIIISYITIYRSGVQMFDIVMHW